MIDTKTTFNTFNPLNTMNSKRPNVSTRDVVRAGIAYASVYTVTNFPGLVQTIEKSGNHFIVYPAIVMGVYAFTSHFV